MKRVSCPTFSDIITFIESSPSDVTGKGVTCWELMWSQHFDFKCELDIEGGEDNFEEHVTQMWFNYNEDILR